MTFELSEFALLQMLSDWQQIAKVGGRQVMHGEDFLFYAVEARQASVAEYTSLVWT